MMAPGPSPIQVTAICASSPDGHKLQIAFYVQGVLLSSKIQNPIPNPSGWTGGIVVVTGPTASVVTVRHFEERSLP
jgi:hypothetical protein